jgi:hypothetical protein
MVEKSKSDSRLPHMRNYKAKLIFYNNKKKLRERTWKTKLLKKSPFTLINCIKLFIFPFGSRCRTYNTGRWWRKSTNQVEKARGGDGQNVKNKWFLLGSSSPRRWMFDELNIVKTWLGWITFWIMEILWKISEFREMSFKILFISSINIYYSIIRWSA